ncbi:MAG: VPLPA-CTERM sorting domain-containing protein [Thiohalocapsa sp. PB-PSB1]|jgi:hypothetical protein|nr:MAG: hypothetical protein N838_25990 [Thiohalocapsa sp. PB-PSB1]QQO56800.1 MAG: VPLPA-CTERM sorting domain-containing protein [Thiohalocapsa sp. PB-PSB1]
MLPTFNMLPRAIMAAGLLALSATNAQALLIPPTTFAAWSGEPIQVDDLTFTLVSGPTGSTFGQITESTDPTGLNFGSAISPFSFVFTVDTTPGIVMTGVTVFDNSVGDTTLSSTDLASVLRAPRFGFINTPFGTLDNLTTSTFTLDLNDQAGGNVSVFGYGAYFDTAEAPMPLPATAWMLITGIGLLAAVARKRRVA